VNVVRQLGQHHRVRVSCAEGRPALEGRQLAVALSEAGIAVDFYTDAGLGTVLDEASMLLVGADAVSAGAWMNKVGTRGLAAAAHHHGLPVHVLATSDKLVMPALWPHVTGRWAEPEEIWPSAPAGIRVRNPYFEAIPIDLATTVITDLGVLGIDMVPDACSALATPAAGRALAELLAAFDAPGANPPS
jgi:methylthioribose-1-phosphate isomerase